VVVSGACVDVVVTGEAHADSIMNINIIPTARARDFLICILNPPILMFFPHFFGYIHIKKPPPY
jgi:hypothetical protein